MIAPVPIALAKICGLTREEDVRLADGLGAHMLGFVLAPSARRVTPERAAAISKGVAAKRVAVTVDASDDELDHIMEAFEPDFIQFHGDERPDRVLQAGARLGVGTIKALGIRTAADMRLAETYAACDHVLYDAKPPEGALVRGGHGVAVDWGLVARSPTPRGFLLAGGLSADNVADAVAQTRCPLVDTSSGVESAPGVKDEGRMRLFFAALSNTRTDR